MISTNWMVLFYEKVLRQYQGSKIEILGYHPQTLKSIKFHLFENSLML